MDRSEVQQTPDPNKNSSIISNHQYYIRHLRLQDDLYCVEEGCGMVAIMCVHAQMRAGQKKAGRKEGRKEGSKVARGLKSTFVIL